MVLDAITLPNDMYLYLQQVKTTNVYQPNTSVSCLSWVPSSGIW